MDTNHSSDDTTSYVLDLAHYDTHGLCSKYTLRRHKCETYVLEYAFLYDNMIELATENMSPAKGPFDHEWSHINPALGKTQIQAKMMTQLTSTDKVCTQRFASLKDYIDIRIVDTGAPFVEAMLLFGMDITLTKEEDRHLESVRKPCYAALGLAND
ncbi:hypothetical protein E8E11_010999 [Didymella keratinophila]|nr:hypothetical protein E8E11_010999 [Didymella keratinophila]